MFYVGVPMWKGAGRGVERASWSQFLEKGGQPRGAREGKELTLAGHCCAWDVTHVNSFETSQQLGGGGGIIPMTHKKKLRLQEAM